MLSISPILVGAIAHLMLCGAVVRAQVSATAAAPSDLRIHRSPQTGHAVFVAPILPGMPEPIGAGDKKSAKIDSAMGAAEDAALPSGAITPEALITMYEPLFGVGDGDARLTRLGSKTDRLGFTHTKFQQVHNAVPVFSGTVIVHQNARGEFAAANGHVYSIPSDMKLVPAIAADAATANAVAAIEHGTGLNAEAGLVIVDPGWYGDPPLGPRLAWHVIIEGDEQRPEAFFIDAHSGKVLDQWPLRHAARDRRVFDGEGLGDFPGVPARFEGDAPLGDPVDVDRAYDYLGDFYDFLYRAYGWDGPDGNGRALVATANAGFSGCPNAFWDARLGLTVFCTGTAVDDIVAHEAMHAVTHYTADLIFQNQPGQLNESFSDVFGELVDLFNGDGAFLDELSATTWPPTLSGPGVDEPNLSRSSLCNDTTDYPDGLRWLIGEEASFGRALRDMWNPTCYDMPDRANHPFQTCPRVDNGGTHTGSSIPNHAFAILTDGKTFNGYTVRGIGPIKAGAVWFRALTHYMTAADDFQAAYLALTQSAADLVGSYPNDPRTGLPSNDIFTQDDAAQVDLALRAVEMDTPSLCGAQAAILDAPAPPDCAAKVVVFADDFESANFGWKVSNSAPPTPYDWVRVSELPRGRDGMAYFCPDAQYGDCANSDESAVHELTSPIIHLPPNAMHYRLRFSHYIATEPGYDGGNVSILAPSGRWVRLSREDFLFNPYNALLRSATRGNANPLAGSPGWTSAGGGWGESIIDLSRWAAPGDTIQIRFSFGKDACNGSDGWYVDDVEVYGCGDCNLNGLADDKELHFRAASAPLSPIGNTSPRSFTIPGPPTAAEEVRVELWAAADLGNFGEQLTLWLNGTQVADVFVGTGRDCPSEADRDSVSVPAPTYNSLVADGAAVFMLTGTPVVDTPICGANNFVAISIDYRTEVADDDGNGVIDHCENCSLAEAPAAEPAPAPARNRYISFVPTNAGRLTALRLSVASIPSSFAQSIAEPMWVDRPWKVTPEGHAFARLTCERVFHDWSAYKVVHVGDGEIVPDAAYDVRALDFACAQSTVQRLDASLRQPSFESPPLRIATAVAWGDLDGNPADVFPVNAKDVARAVDILRGAPTAATTATGDLQPAIPDGRADARDLAAIVDAAKGRPYPFSIECQCCQH